jgi:outer membrane lipoprotein-sorting protein
MNFLRRISPRQLLVLCASVVVLVLGATVIAMATTGGGPKPAPKKLSVAVHDALTAAPVKGVTARVEFTNHLIDGDSIQGKDPLLTGASGRLWASASGRLRLELQADTSHGGVADAQVLIDRDRVSVYDAAANSVYRVTLPRSGHREPSKGGDGPPSVAEIQRAIARLARQATVSGAIPSDVAGRPAYAVRVTPKPDGGLLGGAQLTWDAVHGIPLRVAVYARGNRSPVLELKVTDISFGPLSPSVFNLTPPTGAKPTNLSVQNPGGRRDHGGRSVTGLARVGKRIPFKLTAPPKLVDQPRGEVRLIGSGRESGALVTYGRGLRGIVVIETPANSKARSPGMVSGVERPGLKLPTVSINGARGQELDTALGTVVRFQRGGVEYTVAGSVPPAAVKAAARGL